MKYLALFLMSMFLFVSCGETPDRPDPVMTQAQHDAVNAESAALEAQKAAQAATASTASASTLHYYCTAHPTQGGDAQGSCPECGLALVHNQAYHNTPATPTTPVAPGTPATPAAPASATNAAGVYHYTCSNGCAGGAASQSNCAVCGTPLVHNQAYHN